MILCFSGTGNSLYAAKRIGAVTGDEVISVNALIKRGEKAVFDSDKPYVFVCPTYAWRIPRIFASFIREAALRGSRSAYFVMTCGDDAGNASQYIKSLCRDKELDFMGLAPVVMPENYIALFDVPDRTNADAIIGKAEPVIQAAAVRIRDGAPLQAIPIGLRDRFMSSVVNPVFYAFIVKAKGFYTVASCTGCGVCVKLCPLNNIRLESGRPVWGSKCTHCMACICRCPAGAIEYKRNSQGKPRYVCPEK